jgi:hypothetical protein
MANSDKDILITPNKGTTSLPELSFIGQVNSPIKLRVLDDNTLSFEGSAGQLFSINNNLTTGTIFAVSDVSGVPGISYDANGALKLTPFNGVTMVGGTTTVTSGNELVVVRPNATTAYSLALQVNSGIADGQYDGIAFTQGSGGTTPLGGIRVEYRSNGQPDLGFYTRSGASTETRKLLIYNGGNVSIGGDFASYSRLNVLGGSGLTIRPDSSSTTNRYIYFRQTANDYGFRITQDDSAVGMLFFRAVVDGNDTNPLITLDRPNLRVGIGQSWSTTTRPGYTLDVNGDVNFSGNLYQSGSIFKTLPTQTATTDGSVLRTRFNPATSAYEAYWTHDLDANYRLENPDQWAFRYIINRGYTVAGYQNANPWRNGNRTVHMSDVTISIGDVIDYSAAYIGGSHNGVNLFVYNCANSWLPASAATTSMSMITETNRGLNSSWNDTRARSYSGAWIDFMGNQWRTNAGRNRAYISSGNGNTSRHDLNTEVMTTEIGGTISYVAHAEGEFFAWVSQGQNRFEFSTETFTAWSSYSPAPGCDGINKHQATRIGFFYCSEGGNTDRNVTKRRDSDAVYLRTGISKPETGGEENLHTGMNKGYCISNYNYAQNNNAWIYQYYNDVIRFADGTLTYRKGIPGASSGTGQEGGDMMGAGVAPRTYMTYAGGQQVAPGTMAYGGSTGITQQGGAAVADGSGATGGIGTY